MRNSLWLRGLKRLRASGAGLCAGLSTNRRHRRGAPLVEELECRRVPAAPVVLSIDRASPGPNTSASSVTFAVTFSESVTGVDAADFVVAPTGFVASASPQVTGSDSVYSVSVSGITGRGALGLNLVDNGSIRDLDGNPLSKADARAEFQNQMLFPTGVNPRSLTHGDVNGDGKIDLVSANLYSNSVSVLLGNGDGAFQGQRTFATRNSPRFVAVGDVNADGKADLAVANESSNSVSVLLGNGDGTFQAQRTYAAGALPQSVAIGDVNGDGPPDLVVAANTSGSVGVLLGNGNGTFQAQKTFAAGVPSGVTLGDVNGDGHPDIVATDYNGDSVSVLLGIGDGTFEPRRIFATRSSPRAVVVADLNGDGQLDIVANTNSGGVSVLLGNGDGSFQAQKTFATGGSFSSSVALGDFNGDGKLDIARPAIQVGFTSVLLGNGDGTFQGRQTFATGNQPNSVTVADLNGDGRPDLATVAQYGAGRVSVLLNSGNGNFTGQAYIIEGVAPVVQSIDRAAPSGPSTNASSVTFAVTLSDVATGADLTDFALVTTGDVSATLSAISGTARTYTVTVSGITGAGNLGLKAADNSFTGPVYAIDPVAPFVQPIDRFSPVEPTTTASSVVFTATFSEAVTGVDAADFTLVNSGTTAASLIQVTGSGASYSVTVSGITGSGTLGLKLVYNDSIRDLAGNVLPKLGAAAAFQSQATFATGTGPRTALIGDVNGDGKPDLAIANRAQNSASILLGNGDGTFQAQQTFATVDPFHMAMGDLNGDGKLDLVAANLSRYTVSVLLGNGDGVFQPSKTFAAGFRPLSVALADVNGDGKPDIAVANHYSNPSVLLGNGNGTFQSLKTFTAIRKAYSLTAGDVNGDGRADLVVADLDLDGVSVHLGNGNGTFRPRQTFAAGLFVRSIALGDVNGDGKPDVAVANYSDHSVSVLLGNGNGTFQTQKTFAVGRQPYTVVLGDLNGDDKVDIAAANRASDSMSVLLGNGDGTFQAQQSFAAGAGPRGAALGDLNGDGRLDIAIANRSGNSVSVLVNTNIGAFTGQSYEIIGAVAPPSLVSVTLNADVPGLSGAQRSRVVNVTAVFDQAVELDPGAMTLSLHLLDVRFAGVLMPDGKGAVPSLVFTPSTDHKTWTVTFSGPNTEVGAADLLASLVDGVYDFKIDAAKVHPVGLPNLNLAGGSSTTTFHRLFGDIHAPSTPTGGTLGADFEAVVNTGDNLAFRTAFNKPIDAGYRAFLDFNGDGVINSADNLQFRNRFNKALSWRV
jgi:hypothetical protein